MRPLQSAFFTLRRSVVPTGPEEFVQWRVSLTSRERVSVALLTRLSIRSGCVVVTRNNLFKLHDSCDKSWSYSCFHRRFHAVWAFGVGALRLRFIFALGAF